MNFTVYTKEGCPYCSSILQILLGKDLAFTEYKLDDNFTREEFYAEFGQGSTFPQVVMDGKKLGGCMESVKYLREERII
jgi:glutaredoxin 3|tara:strand:+ start:566 stop:802 length:237 start_codon:yes stop_codon:yes gene_type:complete